MVEIITKRQMDLIIACPKRADNIGKFMYITKDNIYVCCDNQTGDAWVEEFSDLIIATKWLNNLFDKCDKHDRPKEVFDGHDHI